jgi:hypothetical protein
MLPSQVIKKSALAFSASVMCKASIPEKPNS